MSRSKTYLCQWSIEVDADSAEEAALKAEQLMHGRLESEWNVAGADKETGEIEPQRTIDVSIWRRALREAREHDVPLVIGWQYDDHADDGRSLGYCAPSMVGPAFVHTPLVRIEPKDWRDAP